MSKLESAPAAGQPLVAVRLVPVEVFGASDHDCENCGANVECGYGLMDAVSAWSDCNRAIGRIYRVDDIEGRDREGVAGCVTVYLPQADLPKMDRLYGGDTDRRPPDRCPACHLHYTELPDEHRVSVSCTANAPATGR